MRLFIGIPIPHDLAKGLAGTCQRVAPRLRSRITWVSPPLLHITLQFLGEVAESQLPAITAALRSITMDPFVLTPHGAGFFPGPSRPRVLWIGFAQGSNELGQLALAVHDALLPLGFVPDRPFAAHLTLARIKSATPGDPWAEIAHVLAQVPAPAFTVDRMVLWQSVLTPQGPRYVPIVEHPLSAGNAKP